LSVTAPFAQYQSSGKGYDEFRTADGQVRDGWRTIAESLDSLGADGIQTRAKETERLVHESAANFHFDRNDSPARPWELSAVPLVLNAANSRALNAGLQQRVRVLEAVLADLLGAQRLIKERVLPAELLSANPTYQRTYHELPTTSPKRLHLTATDLARNDDGTWWVTGDRTRAPSGLGFALENRIITGRVLPRLIRQNNVHRLAGFFVALQEHLNSIAPRNRDNPRVAILTPGPESYRYFEDAYLARYLGYTLVQGRDLAVRRGQLNLKTLGGLLPLEVLWRNVSDQKCDPLELEPDSTEGVTGLLQTIRRGAIAVANDIGSSMAQMPALLPFLPAAARFLFNEELTLPTVATYWCGGQKERLYVLEHLDELLIRPAFVITGSPPIMPAALSAAARAELVTAMKANPHQYVAQSRPSRSRTPVWHDGQLQSWRLALRSFQLQTARGVEVLPGGLARVSPDTERLDQSPISGRLGQDCWVIGESPVDTETTLLPPAGAPIRLRRSGAELPSRVAENLFWFGRYVERAEAIARLLRTSLTRLSGENEITEMPDVPRLIAALAAIGQIEPDYAIKELGESLPDLEKMLPQSAFDRRQPRGLQVSVMNMMGNASAVRDRISLDAYRILMRIDDDLRQHAQGQDRDIAATLEQINRLITALLAFGGLASESITRTHAWRFLQLGRRIERAWQTAELLSATLGNVIADERILLESVLRASDSLMTYRVRYLLQLQPAAVIDLLITDETNPRSIGFQVQRIDQLIAGLPTDEGFVGLGQDERLAKNLRHQIQMSDAFQLAHADEHGSRNELKTLLEKMITGLPQLSDAITARYLIHTGGAQALTGRLDSSLESAI
jgi:uncharacterized circularly permuted ATP-grasp superfamily protein/uncharacterized alpha-E superfamily protein